MSAYLAGIAQTRCEEHPKADQIDGPARAVLAAMAWFCGDKDDVPRCYASQAKIVSKTGLARRTVQRAQDRMAALGGVAERVEHTNGGPVHWLLHILAGEAEPASERRRSSDPNLRQRDAGGASERRRYLRQRDAQSLGSTRGDTEGERGTPDGSSVRASTSRPGSLSADASRSKSGRDERITAARFDITQPLRGKLRKRAADGVDIEVAIGSWRNHRSADDDDRRTGEAWAQDLIRWIGRERPGRNGSGHAPAPKPEYFTFEDILAAVDAAATVPEPVRHLIRRNYLPDDPPRTDDDAQMTREQWRAARRDWSRQHARKWVIGFEAEFRAALVRRATA